jgi:hypothetical protein
MCSGSALISIISPTENALTVFLPPLYYLSPSFVFFIGSQRRRRTGARSAKISTTPHGGKCVNIFFLHRIGWMSFQSRFDIPGVVQHGGQGWIGRTYCRLWGDLVYSWFYQSPSSDPIADEMN